MVSSKDASKVEPTKICEETKEERDQGGKRPRLSRVLAERLRKTRSRRSRTRSIQKDGHKFQGTAYLKKDVCNHKYRSSKLVTLDLSNNNEYMQSLSNMIDLGQLHDCTYLSMKDNNIGELDIRLLTDALPSIPNLEKLFLQRNTIRHTQISYFASALPSSRIISLGLSGNNIDDVGIIQLVSFHNPILRSLYINNNNIGDSGFDTLANQIRKKQMPVLRNLEIRNNSITNVTADHLTAFTSNCKPNQFCVLDVSHNPITNKKFLMEYKNPKGYDPGLKVYFYDED